ncbi:HAMP domain-containing sensor histidine kinase [Williamsia sp.]|uniref:sensor histidine kinase n=1 Tax=Williamsia sp. TaxID=1872085 RepID=UPI002F956700
MSGRRHPRTLRFRLGVALGLLTVAITLVAPLLSVLLVRDHLEERAAEQLISTSDRIGAALSAVSPIQVPAQQVRALLPSLAVFVVVDSTGQGLMLGSAGTDLTTGDLATFVRETDDLGPGRAERITVGSQVYAVARVPTPGIIIVDGASTVEVTDLIIGLEQRDNDLLVQRLLWYTVAGACVSMIVVGGVGAYLLRRGLRPLERMAGATATSTGGDMQTVVSHVAHSNSGAEIIALATALESAFAARQDAENRMRNFVADASHELRAPVTTMSSWIDHYLQGGLTTAEDIDRMIARLEAETGRMRLLLDEMTLLTRSDAGVQYELTEMDVGELVHEVVADAGVVTPEREISYWCSGPARVLGDQHRLRQVFGNIVGNAQEHTPAGRPIGVRVTAGAADVRVEIRDHGEGIPPEQLVHLFDRFWRAEPGGSRTQRHSGLGLAIVKAIVEAHDGTTTVTSEPGVGTVVTVILPSAENTVS